MEHMHNALEVQNSKISNSYFSLLDILETIPLTFLSWLVPFLPCFACLLRCYHWLKMSWVFQQKKCGIKLPEKDSNSSLNGNSKFNTQWLRSVCMPHGGLKITHHSMCTGSGRTPTGSVWVLRTDIIPLSCSLHTIVWSSSVECNNRHYCPMVNKYGPVHTLGGSLLVLNGHSYSGSTSRNYLKTWLSSIFQSISMPDQVSLVPTWQASLPSYQHISVAGPKARCS